VTVRPLLVDEPVNVGLTGRAWLLNSSRSSTLSSCSAASRRSSNSGVDVILRVLESVAGLGLGPLLGLISGDGDGVRTDLAGRIGDIERSSSMEDSKSFNLPGESGRSPGVLESCLWGRLA
jgi:hypothetical protein